MENLSTRAGAGMKSSGYDQETDCVSKGTANLGAVYPQGPIGARLRDFVTRTAAISTQPSPRLPSGYDTEGDLLSKACYNLGGGTPTGSAYDRLYAIVQATGATKATLLTGLIAHWKLNETSGTRADSHTNGYNLTDINGMGYTTAVLGNGMSTAGEDDYLSTSLTWDSPSRAASVWFRRSSAIFEGGYPAYTYLMLSGLGITMRDDGALFWDDVLPVSPPYNDDTWHHLALVYASTTETFSYYIDGALQDSGPLAGPLAGATSLGLAYPNGFANGPIDMDSVSIWSRALTAAEITTLYNGGAGLDYQFFGA